MNNTMIIYVFIAISIFTLLYLWWIWKETDREKEIKRQIDYLKHLIDENNKNHANVKINFDVVSRRNGKDYVICIKCRKEVWNMTTVVMSEGHICPDCYSVVRYL